MRSLIGYISVLFISIPLFISGSVVEKIYTFKDYRVQESRDYQVLHINDLLVTGLVGEPALPYQKVVLMLAPGEEAVAIEFEGMDPITLPGTYRIYPQQPSRPLSLGPDHLFYKNEAVYHADMTYPVQPTGQVITSFLSGHGIALSSFTPVTYNPATGKVSIFRTVKIRIITKSSEAAALSLMNFKTTAEVQHRIGQFIQNEEMLQLYPNPAKSDFEYNLLIITPSQFAGSFQPLMDTYLLRGIVSQVVTKETINSTVSGQDLAEKIRNFIIQEYQESSIDFVLLGGDVEHIPYRGFYCYVQSGSGYEDSNIPADLYYSALDGNWNNDNDNRWGEIGEDDLLPEVAVARYPFSNATELNGLLNKTLMYQNNPVLGEFNDATLAGEWLYSNPLTYGSDYLELLIGYQNENGYETWGIPETYDLHKLYEEIAPWGANDLIAEINAGRQYIHHVGHANSTYVAYMSNSTITNNTFSGANGTSHNFTIFHSHGCICGAFDDNDCIMERMVNIDNFAVAVVGNSRYGWFNEGQTEGPAAHLHREMMDALYHEKLFRIGEAFVESKIQTAPWVTAPGQWEEGALRWNFYDINILGDPALGLWTAEPITIQATYQTALPIGIPSTLVNVTSGGSPVEGMMCVIIQDGIIYGKGITDASGNATLTFNPVFTTVGAANLIVSGNNCLPAVYPVSIIPNDGAYVIYSGHEIDDSMGNNNGEVDSGETILLTVEVENVGSVQANNVLVSLSTTDSYVTVIDGLENYGSIPGGAAVSVTNGFTFSVSDAVPDMHLVTFQTSITGDETWTSAFPVYIYAPALSVGTLVIDDSGSGNGNGLLDPGETVSITIGVSNEGHCYAENTFGNITTASPELAIVNGNCNLGLLQAGTTGQATFIISVDPDASPGTSVNINFDVYSGNYSAQQVFYLSIGQVIEDFETGNFLTFGWEFGGNANWTITSQNPYEGLYSAKSGSINHQQETVLILGMDVMIDDEISFYRKVSSEANYDFLRFYIDNNEVGSWSGEVAWSQVTFPVSSGSHTFKWKYQKDASVANGSDCAWIDYILFPAATGMGNLLNVNVSASPPVICLGQSSQLVASPYGGTGNYSYQWEPTAGLNNPTIANPLATPDQTTIYTVTVNDGSGSVSDGVEVTVNPVPETPVITQVDQTLVSSAISGNQWYNSGGIIPGATGQVYEPLFSDHYYVKVGNEFGCESAPSNIIYFLYTGIRTNPVSGIRIYPNPMNDQVVIEYQIISKTKVDITILDKLGRIVNPVISGEIKEPGFYSDWISLPGIEAGVYVVQIQTNQGYLSHKLIVSR